MKFNSVRVLIIISLIIIFVYTLGLFLPIIFNTKNSKIEKFSKVHFVYVLDKKNYFSLSLGNNSTKLQGL